MSTTVLDPAQLRLSGAAIVYRLFDVGYAIDLCRPHAIELSARIFDFGVVSLRGRVSMPDGLTGRRFAALLSRLQAVVGDTTELVEHVENALKVTDDV